MIPLKSTIFYKETHFYFSPPLQMLGDSAYKPIVLLKEKLNVKDYDNM